jgi:hypothetical protein
VPFLGRQQDETRLLVELSDGERRFVPVAWTDRQAVRDYPAGVKFPIETLLALREKLDNLDETHTMTGKKKGASHERRTSQPVAADDGRTAVAGDCDTGADAAGTGQGGGR